MISFGLVSLEIISIKNYDFQERLWLTKGGVNKLILTRPPGTIKVAWCYHKKDSVVSLLQGGGI